MSKGMSTGYMGKKFFRGDYYFEQSDVVATHVIHV